VHRAGRTGRAGRKGICVTLYKHSQGDLIRAIERGTGNTLRRIGAPQPEDLLVAAAGDAGDKFADLSKQIVAKFLPSADKIIKAMGAREALAAALAQITGFTDTAMLMPSSVLQCAKGYVTLQYDSATPLNGLGLVWAALRRELPPQAVENVRGMTLTEDMLGAVFDYDLRFKDDLDKALEEQQDAKLRIITELPPLQEKPSFSPGNFGGGARGGFSGSRGGFGARGGARGGFGAARGRGGARGRGRGGW
jgi:ATP-dependent RNA helicase DDX21